MVRQSQHKAAPLYAQVREALRRDLARRQPGDRLVPERELATQFAVDVVTVRRALFELATEGFLLRQQGRGTFVTEKAAELRRVLWVTGQDLFQARVSQYWLDCLCFAKPAFAAHGMATEAAWLDSFDVAACTPYLADESAARYLGYAFVGCDPAHPLLQFVRQRRLPRVQITMHSGTELSVCTDYRQGIALALATLAAKGHRRITYVANSLRPGPELLPSLPGVELSFIETLVPQRAVEIEGHAYRRTREALATGTIAPAVFVLDDVMARGVTRALLESGTPRRKLPDVVVMCGRQEMIPFGLPVTYVVHDTEFEVREAVRILAAQVQGRSGAAALSAASRFLLDDGSSVTDAEAMANSA